MSNDKCFCHLNGYAVKDATARAEIEALKKTVAEMGSVATVKSVSVASNNVANLTEITQDQTEIKTGSFETIEI